jgi:hypothetical protein
MSNPQVLNLPPGAPAMVESPAGRGVASRVPPAPASAFVPVLLCALTLLVWFAFQAVLLLGDRDALQATRQAQQATVDNAGKLRASLDSLAVDTQSMADGGNPSAKLLIDELHKHGITINPTAPATRPAKTAAP